MAALEGRLKGERGLKKAALPKEELVQFCEEWNTETTQTIKNLKESGKGRSINDLRAQIEVMCYTDDYMYDWVYLKRKVETEEFLDSLWEHRQVYQKVNEAIAANQAKIKMPLNMTMTQTIVAIYSPCVLEFRAGVFSKDPFSGKTDGSLPEELPKLEFVQRLAQADPQALSDLKLKSLLCYKNSGNFDFELSNGEKTNLWTDKAGNEVTDTYDLQQEMPKIARIETWFHSVSVVGFIFFGKNGTQLKKIGYPGMRLY